MIETKRLFIRRMQAEDAAFIVELLNDASFLANIGDKGVRTLEDALGYIQSAGWDNYTEFGFGMNTVELADSAARIGICGLLKRPTLDHPDPGHGIVVVQPSKRDLDPVSAHPIVGRVSKPESMNDSGFLKLP